MKAFYSIGIFKKRGGIETLAPIELDLGEKNGFYVINFAHFVINGLSHEHWKNYIAQLKKMNIGKYVAIYQKYYDFCQTK
ncbi:MULTISPECIES: hypothetical protein [Paenibacillus]|uniref:hypothetical protein n=1 Tax=Paenibacillus TaxID=44249 RepID=UPI000B7F21F7|nr:MULTISPECIES: hypothetical protein [unclassified Paenibacillus]OXL87533.1 hypothetical protein BCV73_34120 [Paenibacillus sp. SSG-1]